MIPLHDDNPTRITPVVTIALIGLCVMAFLWQLSLGPQQEAAIYALGVIPAVILDHAQLVSELEWVDPMLTPFTSMFLHGGFLLWPQRQLPEKGHDAKANQRNRHDRRDASGIIVV